MVTKIDPIQHFKKAISLLQNNPDCEACLAYGRIAGWNYALEETPLLITALWNAMLPKKLHVGHDAFEDKGWTPENMTRNQMEKIQEIEKVPTDPMVKGFDPFYFWKMPYPTQSKVFIQKQHEMRKLKDDWYKKHCPEPPKMKHQRYWGD